MLPANRPICHGFRSRMGRADDGFPHVGISSRVVPGVPTNENLKNICSFEFVPSHSAYRFYLLLTLF